jgi:hypothetical protein
LEPITQQLSAQVWFSSGRPQGSTSEEREVMEALIARSELDMRVELGGMDLPASELMQLQEGDTIVLDQRVGRPLQLIVDDLARFEGLPGMSGKHLALRVTDVVEPDYEFGAPALTGLRLPPEELELLKQAAVTEGEESMEPRAGSGANDDLLAGIGIADSDAA